MARINIPSPEQAPDRSKATLDAVRAKLGLVPNLFRIIANSPAALEGYMALSGALSSGRLDLKTRERIALAVAEVNGCSYCLSAHSYIGSHMAKMDQEDLRLAREGHAAEPRSNAAVELAVVVTRGRGNISPEELARARAGGLDEEEILEVLANVALNLLTNYINVALETEVDFPLVEARRAA